MTTDIARLAAKGQLIGYFGYGSLVNRATLAPGVVAAFPARLKGWGRTWRPRPDMGTAGHAEPGSPLSAPGPALPPTALLTAHRDPEAAIDGLLILDRAENLGSLDAREFRYHRRRLDPADLVFAGARPDIDCALHIYEARMELPAMAGAPLILRSYLDVVMQGFLREFGETGVARFVAETGAFDTGIHEDREAPVYSRAVRLGASETTMFDAALSARAATRPSR